MLNIILHKIRKKLFSFLYPREARIVKYVREKNLTYCGYPKLENMSILIMKLRKMNIPGIYVEAGVALGGSAILIAKLKEPTAPLYLYDVFGMIPPPSAADGTDAHHRYSVITSGNSVGLGNDQYYGYRPDVKSAVIKNIEEAGVNLQRNNIHLIEGFFENTMTISTEVAFAHIDADWYESVKTCINRISPNVSLGGIIIFDDYNSYSGCKKAVDEFLLTHRDFRIILNDRSTVISRVNV